MLKIQNDTIVQILWKQIQGEMITKEEKKILNDWCSDSIHNQHLFDEIMDEEQRKNDLKLLLNRNDNAIWNKILPQIGGNNNVPEVVKIRKSWYNYAAAAALIGVILSAGAYFMVRTGSHEEIAKTTTVAQTKKNEVNQDERAFLKLSDGSIIYLDGAENGVLAREGSSKINKLKDGELMYDAANSLSSDQLPLTFNTLSTPRGTQYKLILPDGSKIWLNAASSLRFPPSFNDGERVVELKGEAYFEIAPSKLTNSPGTNHRFPFLVKANGMNVEVLGTHFNVMAYENETEMSTSLVEGSVKVNKGASICLLKPGQQARVANDMLFPVKPRAGIRVINGGTDEAIAWKNGYLSFKGADVGAVMRQISRSYKVDVVYTGQPSTKFSGKIDLNTNISEVINALKYSGINVRLENNKVIVTP